MNARRAAEFAAFAAALGEAVESRGLEALAGHGLGAAAAAQALTQSLAADRVELLDFLKDRDKLRLAA